MQYTYINTLFNKRLALRVIVCILRVVSRIHTLIIGDKTMDRTLWFSKAEELSLTISLIKKLTLERKTLESQLKTLQDNKSFTHARFTYECVVHKGTIEYKKIPALMGLDLESFRKEDTERWLFKTLY